MDRDAVARPWDTNLTVYDSEAALLEGLRRRDRPACTCLLKRYMPRLYRLARQIAGTADDAEDILQESFIKACSQIDTFEARSGSSLGTWLYRIVLNTALMHVRKRKGDVVRLDSPPGVAADDIEPGRQGMEGRELADRAHGPGEQVLSGELRQVLDASILDLPDTLRQAFVLRDVEGLSTAEAAEALGITESALKVRLHRARLALREALGPYMAEPAFERGGIR